MCTDSTSENRELPLSHQASASPQLIRDIMTDAIKNIYESSELAKYKFEEYWPSQKLRICVTGAGGERGAVCRIGD